MTGLKPAPDSCERCERRRSCLHVVLFDRLGIDRKGLPEPQYREVVLCDACAMGLLDRSIRREDEARVQMRAILALYLEGRGAPAIGYRLYPNKKRMKR